MKLSHRYPILGSSQDPNKISMTIKSIGLAIIPVIVAIGRMNGVELVENDLIQIVTGVAGVVSTVGVIWGVIRKYL